MSYEIIEGRKKVPFNILVLGVPGIGKSTFAANSPDPLFMGAEENDELNVKRLPKPKDWNDAVAQLDFMINEKPKFQTAVIDTIDSLQKLLHAHVLYTSKNKTSSMAKAHGGYGAGYDTAQKEFFKFRNKLVDLRDNQGKNILILSHVKKSQATDPIMGMEYDTFEMNLHHKEQEVFVDWCQAVLFANYVNHKAEMDNTSDKKFMIGEGERVLLTEKRPGHLGKNRLELPYELELPADQPFKPFMEYYERFFSGKERSADEIEKNIEGLASNLEGQDVHSKIMDTLEKNRGNVQKLKQIEKRLKERLSS